MSEEARNQSETLGLQGLLDDLCLFFLHALEGALAVLIWHARTSLHVARAQMTSSTPDLALTDVLQHICGATKKDRSNLCCTDHHAYDVAQSWIPICSRCTVDHSCRAFCTVGTGAGVVRAAGQICKRDWQLGQLVLSQGGILSLLNGATANSSTSSLSALNITIPANLTNSAAVQQIAQVSGGEIESSEIRCFPCPRNCKSTRD